MHLLECRGVANWVYGAALWLLVRDNRLGRPQEERIKKINAMLQSYYSTWERPGGSRLPRIRLTDLKNARGDIELSGQAIKAAATRLAAPFFLEFAQMYFNAPTVHDESVREVCGRLVECYAIMDEPPSLSRNRSTRVSPLSA